VFASAREAIRAAVDLQQRFVEETLEDPELPLTVGIGLDAGEAVEVQGGYRGGALNLAARLCGQARAGEILASREITHLARSLDGIRYQDRGALMLKGLTDPVSVVRIVPDEQDPAERLRPFAPAPPPRAKPRRPWVAAIGVAVVLALVAIAIPLLGEATGPDVGTNSIARLDPSDGSVELTSSLGQRPGAAAVGFGSLWVLEPDRNLVARVALEDGSVTDTIRVGNSPEGIAAGQDAVWVTNGGDGTVSRIAPGTNEVSQTLDAGSGPAGIAVGEGSLWVADRIGAALLRIDPVTGKSEAVDLPGEPSHVAFTPQGVWVSVAPSRVVRIDASNPAVTLGQDVGSEPTAVLPAFGSIWVTNHLDGTVTRVEPSTGRVVATIGVGGGPNALVAAGDTIWVGNEFDGSITTIDPGSNGVDRTIPVGGTVASIVAEGDGLWLSVGALTGEHRGGTLTISSEQSAPSTLDPAVAYDSLAWQILTITNDGLLAYKRVGGPDGVTLVPDLASALPDVSTDGLTYRFPLRDAIRYSTGQPVRPEDFRYGLERAASVEEGPAVGLLGAIEGVKRCNETPESCDLSGSVVTDEDSVTIHLAEPDPELPFKLALPFAFPVPTDVAAEDRGLEPVPATGPYLIAAATEAGIELVRNPEFEEWSRAAQPDGFVDAISWRFGEDPEQAFDRLLAGEVDWMADPPSPEDLAALRIAHPDQVVQTPQLATFFVGLDVLRPPFDDARVRQALNYAIDRERVVELMGGAAANRPTCQILPPNFQGYEPFCPYTPEPQAGTWSAPDPVRARELVEEAGAVGSPVTAWTTDLTGTPGSSIELMEYVAEVLGDLGLRVRLKAFRDQEAYFDGIYSRTPGSRRHPHVFLSGCIIDIPRAADFIEPQLRCDGFANPFGFCDERIDAQIDEARRLQATDPGASNRAWIEIEHRLVEEAVWVPLANPITSHAFSARVGNVQLSPQWGLLLSRIWVR
jgi:YVTN family beta-propeller protein